MKLGYLGPEGTFSFEAARSYASGIDANAELIPYPTLHDVLFACDREHIDAAIVPVENSIEGTIGVVQDMLVKEVDLKVKDEFVLAVDNSLLSVKGAFVSGIKKVLSHPQPLEQCRNWIRKNLPEAVLRSTTSTSEAAKEVSVAKDTSSASIGSASLASIYGLEVLVKDINDYPDNETRFIVVAKADSKQTGTDKTSVVFSILSDRPGGLYGILAEFAKRKINLTKIESRPSKKALGDYFFFVDMEGHRTDKQIADALADMSNKVAFIKILGSYPRKGK